MKRQRKIEKDNRGVAIYARKSRITNKGDSIGVQFKQCADYAKKELGLDEEYEFLQYEDKGLSGYFSDRPDFQRMLHDVQDGKIKAIVCYKLDRVGRKTADLIRLMDFLEMYHVNLLICSNGINTASGLYKIFIQIFAVIAEFERDTLTERIVDNMMELAKDGRWLGGNTPMGFTVRRVTTGSGKGKSAYSYLESLPEEKCMVQRLYEIFRTTRSIQTTAKQMNEEGFHTPPGATFNASTTRLVLRNPIYCTADKRSYNYFIEHDGKDAQPEVLVTLIQTIVERIYIVDKDDERYCHIFIKGCSGEDYTGFFQTAGYIEQKTTPVCDSEQYCIVNT